MASLADKREPLAIFVFARTFPDEDKVSGRVSGAKDECVSASMQLATGAGPHHVVANDAQPLGRRPRLRDGASEHGGE
jgi:hypothetical protein